MQSTVSYTSKTKQKQKTLKFKLCWRCGARAKPARDLCTDSPLERPPVAQPTPAVPAPHGLRERGASRGGLRSAQRPTVPRHHPPSDPPVKAVDIPAPRAPLPVRESPPPATPPLHSWAAALTSPPRRPASRRRSAPPPFPACAAVRLLALGFCLSSQDGGHNEPAPRRLALR